MIIVKHFRALHVSLMEFPDEFHARLFSSFRILIFAKKYYFSFFGESCVNELQQNPRCVTTRGEDRAISRSFCLFILHFENPTLFGPVPPPMVPHKIHVTCDVTTCDRAIEIAETERTRGSRGNGFSRELPVGEARATTLVVSLDHGGRETRADRSSDLSLSLSQIKRFVTAR